MLEFIVLIVNKVFFVFVLKMYCEKKIIFLIICGKLDKIILCVFK